MPLTLIIKISPTSVTQSSVDMAKDEFGENNYGKNKSRILSALFVSKDLTKAGYLTSNTKKAFKLL